LRGQKRWWRKEEGAYLRRWYVAGDLNADKDAIMSTPWK
jgi:hypothetical protein